MLVDFVIGERAKKRDGYSRALYRASGLLNNKDPRQFLALQAVACHENVNHPFLHTERHPLDAATAAGLVHVRLLHLFSDVFCLFLIGLSGSHKELAGLPLGRRS